MGGVRSLNEADPETVEMSATSSPYPLHPSSDDLLRCCAELLSDIEALQDFIRDVRGEAIDTRKFRASIVAEQATLRSATGSADGPAPSAHTLKSSNLPFHTAVWRVAKTCSQVTALGKRFKLERPGKEASAGSKNRQAPPKSSVLVDVVAANSEEWVKVSTMTERRLLFEIAEVGWEEGPRPPGPGHGHDIDDDPGHAEGSPASQGSTVSDSDGDARCDEIGLVRAARELVLAAGANRVRWRAPRVRFVLTRIREGASTNMDRVLAGMRAAGAAVQCGCPGFRPHETLEETFHRMLPASDAGILSSLNLDCTILLALISDISHCRLEPEPSQHSSVRRQIASEPVDRLLPSLLYPVLKGKPLFTAVPAACRMREIVETLGTPSEKARAAILLGEVAVSGMTGPEMRLELAKWSVHPVPVDLELPVSIVPESDTPDLSGLPASASQVAKSMSRINKSVFLLGWKQGWTTITSNRAAVRSIESALAEEPVIDQAGPSLWLCKTARSLLGKEKKAGEA